MAFLLHINMEDRETHCTPQCKQAPGWSFEATMEATEVLKRKIIDTSQKSQEVLLLLLSDNDDLRQRLGQEVTDRKRETRELRD